MIPLQIITDSIALADTLTASAADTLDILEEEIITDTTAALAPEVPAEVITEMSLWDLCVQGGWAMIPLALLLLVAIYIFVQRCIVLSRAEKLDDNFMNRIKGYVREGELESALNLCRHNDTPLARLVAKGIARLGRPAADIQTAIENTGNIEVAALSAGLPWLATTAAGAPMLGFLGTVIGMVRAFYAIAQAGNAATIDSFAGGIYSALVTTVAGLIVGVLALFGYNYLVARVNRIMNHLEAATMEFMDLADSSRQ